MTGFYFGEKMKTKIGVPSGISCLPLRRWIDGRSSFEVHGGSIVDLAAKFRNRELDAAFVSPIEYARESSEYRILPGFALSSRSGITLHFREGLRTIGTMAADPAGISEIVLARIVLAEEFETAPPIVPSTGARLHDLLKKADSVLLTGDARLREKFEDPNSIDITEIWSDMVNLPYVHGILCARDGAVTPEALKDLASQDWDGILDEVADSDFSAALHGDEQVARAREFLGQCSFGWTTEAEEGLSEFLRYAHYHGMIPDIPQLQPYSPEMDDPFLN